jgi:hypothetical protein
MKTFSATISNGKLRIRNRQSFDVAVSLLKDGNYEMKLERVSKKRTNLQNSFYWGVIIPLCTKGLLDLGHAVDSDDTHEILKAMFNKKQFVNEQTGEVTHYGGSTQEMTTTDSMAYWERIYQFASEHLNVFIPEPQTDWRKT